MKILQAVFENFTGIYSGLNTTKVELDFTKGSNEINMLIGGNGSGKSTLISILHPYRDTMDSRSSDYILKDKKGYKKIVLQNNKDIYEIEHFYNKPNKSYIKKNGTELNDSGAIKLFESILVDELKLTKDYFKIGRLGSNVANFIDLTTANRKKYISNILPNIDGYLKRYEIVNEKYKKLNTSIKVIKEQLSKYRDKDELLDQINSIKKIIQEKEETVSELKVSLAVEKNNIESIISEIDLPDSFNDYGQYLNNLKNAIDTHELNISKDKELLEAIFLKHSNLKEKNHYELLELKEKFLSNVNQFKNNLENETEKLTNLKNNLIVINNEIQTNSKKLHLIDYDKLNATKELIEKNTEIIKDNKEIINNGLLYDINEYTSKNNQTAINTISIVEDIIENLARNHKNYLFELDYDSSIIEKTFKNISASQKQIEDLTLENDNLKAKINSIQSQEYLLETLEKRPINCVIDDCPFIVKALNYKNNEYSLYDSIAENLKQNELKILQLEKYVEEQTEIYNYFRDLKSIKETNSSVIKLDFENTIFNNIGFNFNPDTIHSMLKLSLEKSLKIFEPLKQFTNIYYAIQTTEKLESNLKSLEIDISELAKNEEINKIYNAKIEELNISLKEVNSNILETEEKIESIEKQIKVENYKVQIVQNIISIEDKITDNEKEKNNVLLVYNKVSNILKSTEKHVQTQSTLNTIINDTTNELNSLKNELEILIKQFSIVDDNLNRLAEIELNYNKIEKIKKALDPKIGIPIIFINNYLTHIAVKTNELLKIAYGDSFKIKFEVTPSDFFIRVFKSDGTFLNDISESSQGETSLTSVSLSLAMIEQQIQQGKTLFDIFYVDEVDSTLSVKNRRLFISMLEKQISELGLEQIFIISHNNEFETYNVDLILLNENNADVDDPEFMSNKSVIFNIKDLKE